jgi:hypothetical protein
MLDTNGLRTSESSIWFTSSSPYYIVGDGIYTMKQPGENAWKSLLGLTANYTEKIRGNADNDFFIVGDYGTVLHYNGSSFRNYQTGGTLPYIDGVWESVDVKRNFVVAVGILNNRAALLRGTRK